MTLRPGDRVGALWDMPATGPFETHVLRGGEYVIDAVDELHGLVAIAGDRPMRWLTGLGFARVEEERK